MTTTNALKPFSFIRHDLWAGIVVFLVALPLCLGIAVASQAPVISGILAGIVGGFLVGILSGSHTSVSGPAAGLTAIIAHEVVSFGSFEAFLPVIIVAGLIQIILGSLKAGFIASFFPGSVIKGLLAAIGIILVLKQLPHLTGFDVDYEGDMAFFQNDNENTFSEIVNIFSNVHWGAFIIGLLSLAFIFYYQKIPLLKKSNLPAPILIVMAGIGLSLLLAHFWPSLTIESAHLVTVPILNSPAEFSKLLLFPDVQSIFSQRVLVAGFGLAMVASLETLLNIEAVDKIDPHQRKSPPNRELIAQGIGNMVLGFIGGLPITSVVIRSSVNINAQAKSKLSTIFHGLLLFLLVVFFPTTLNLIPLSCLAAILIYTGSKLFSPSVIKQMWQQGTAQFVPFIVTITAIVLTDLLIGVTIGLLTSFVFIIKNSAHGEIRVIKEKRLQEEIFRIFLPHQLSFLMRGSLRNVLESLPQRSHVVLDATDTSYIDADCLDLIKDFTASESRARDIVVSLESFKDSYNLKDRVNYSAAMTREVQENMSISEVLDMFKEGHQRAFLRTPLKRDLHRQINATAHDQFPVAVVLSCIDSRVPAELIFDLGIGEIFNVRMAGNVTSPKVLGSIEFACAVGGAKLIVVMGHSNCGAIKSSVSNHLRNEPSLEEFLNLRSIVKEINEVIASRYTEKKELLLDREKDLVHEITVLNIHRSIANIRAHSKKLDELYLEGKIDIVGCIYDVLTGQVEFLDNEFSKDARLSKPFSALKHNQETVQ